MAEWKQVLELSSDRRVVSGSATPLAEAIRAGADLRVGTEFLHNQHIDVTSPSAERIREVAEFGVTYLLQDSWAAGVMSLRQPISLPLEFGPRPSMSFFLYNEDGQQAIARPYLDGVAPSGEPGSAPPDTPANMPKYHTQSTWDAETNAPASNFVYDFDVYRFHVRDGWREVLSHDADGRVRSGSVAALVEAFSAGREVKVSVRGLCDDLADANASPIDHEVFVQIGSSYYYTEQALFIAGSHPVVRVKPGIPLLYQTRGWDFGWLMLRTDGRVVYRCCDPYTLKFEDRALRCAIRWFVNQ